MESLITLPPTPLPADCLEEIFNELLTDKKTLFSCLLVNRLWCETVVDKLWQQPFRLLYLCRYNKLHKDCGCTCINRQKQAVTLIEVILEVLLSIENFKRRKPEPEGTLVLGTLFNYPKFI